MGAVSFSLDPRLVQELQKLLPLRVFVETGTFRGETVERIADLFDTVHSVELSEPCYRDTAARLAYLENVHLACADSAAFLSQQRPHLASQSVLYWLDAHWCVADKTAGAHSQCPILQELHAIGQLNPTSVLLIDDARLYLAPPPEPHDISHWPRFDEILRELQQLSCVHSLTVWNDVLVFLPHAIADRMQPFFARTGVDWLWAMEQSRTYNQLLGICQEREAEIHRLKAKHDEAAAVAAERHAAVLHIQDQFIALSAQVQGKETELHRLKSACDQVLADAQNKEAEIRLLKAAGNDRLALIETLTKVCAERELAIAKLTELLQRRQKAFSP